MIHAFHTRYYEYSNIICQMRPRSLTMAQEIFDNSQCVSELL